MTPSNLVEDAGDAARLVGFALRPKLAQGADPDYAALCGRYRVDTEFRDLVAAIVDGLGLVVLAFTDQGLIVCPAHPSPFTFRLRDYPGYEAKRRALIGLVQLGIAATCYPRETDLETHIAVRRSIHQVERLLRSACETLAEQEADDRVAGAEELAWRAYKTTPSSLPRKGGGFTAGCTLGVITTAFNWLVDQGFAQATSTAGTYLMLDRYRVQVRELAGHAALERLRALARDPAAAAEPADAPGEG
jgi:hypothetical protein